MRREAETRFSGRRAAAPREKERLLLVLVFDGNLFQVLGFENLTAVKTLYVLDPVTSGDDLGTGMFTSSLHRAR